MCFASSFLNNTDFRFAGSVVYSQISHGWYAAMVIIDTLASNIVLRLNVPVMVIAAGGFPVNSAQKMRYIWCRSSAAKAAAATSDQPPTCIGLLWIAMVTTCLWRVLNEV